MVLQVSRKGSAGHRQVCLWKRTLKAPCACDTSPWGCRCELPSSRQPCFGICGCCKLLRGSPFCKDPLDDGWWLEDAPLEELAQCVLVRSWTSCNLW